MKTKITIVLALILSLCVNSFAQVDYKILKDDPTLVPKNFVYFYYFDFQASMLSDQDERHSAVGGIGSSIQGWHHITPKIGVDVGFKLTYSGDATEVQSKPIYTDVGAFYRLSEKRKTKDVKVNVSTFKTVVTVEDEHGNFRGFADAVGVNQILVPGTYLLQNSVKAGLVYQNGTYDRSLEGLGSYQSMAVAIGFVRESKVHVVTQLLNRKTVSAQYMRFYADLMVFPVLNVTNANIGQTSRVGFRAGAIGSFPGSKNFLNYMAPKVEIGYHGLHGSYMQVGFGVNVFKS